MSCTKAPLCKGSWHGAAVTEGLWLPLAREAVNPSVCLTAATSLKVNCPEGAREGGLGHYTREALARP